MTKLITTFMLIAFMCGLAWGDGLYRNEFETGDTLVSNTADTSSSCLLYNGSTTTTRPIRPTVFVYITEIGSNSTHYWIQYDVDVADANIAKDGNGWSRVFTGIERDWEGLATGTQNDFAIPMPFLESYAGKYFRVILTCPKGIAADSTSYALAYDADASGNMYTPPVQTWKVITHDMMFRSGSEQSINGTASADSVLTDVLDLRIETTPGNFKLPTRGYLQTIAGSKTDSDSLTVYVRSVLYNTFSTDIIDTLTIPTSGAAEFSFTLSEGTGFVEAVKLTYINEGRSADDTTRFFSEVHLEYNP